MLSLQLTLLMFRDHTISLSNEVKQFKVAGSTFSGILNLYFYLLVYHFNLSK